MRNARKGACWIMSLKKGNSAAAAGAVATLAILSIAVLVMVRKYGR